MDLDRLYVLLGKTSAVFRKGAEVEHRDGATHVYGMPHMGEMANLPLVPVDCHFVMVGVHREKAEAAKAELLEILAGYPQPERLAGGPSYIEVGAVIGDQGAAFLLFAVGEVLGLWKVITPEKLGFSGPEADQLAGSGLVMISGLKPQASGV